MTGIKDFNQSAFDQVAQKLRGFGFSVFNPAEYPGDRPECLVRDTKELPSCSSLVLLNGWEKSPGVHYEVRIELEPRKSFFCVEHEHTVLGINTYLRQIPNTEVEVTAQANQFRVRYPHGHPHFLEPTLAELQLHSDKNHDYSSGGDPLGNFDRVAAIKQLYPGFPDATPAGVAINNLLKQLNAVLWGLSKSIEHKVEGYAGRLQDISVYSKIVSIILDRDRNDHQLETPNRSV